MKKSILTGLTCLGLAMTSMAALSAVSADDKKSPPAPITERTIQKTEADLMEACLDEKDNDPAACKCVLSGFKTELKGKDYTFLMTVLALSKKDEGEALRDLILDRSMLDLLRMVKRLEMAANAVEKQCDGVTLKFDDDTIKI